MMNTSPDVIKSAVHELLHRIPNDVTLTLFQGEQDQHNLGDAPEGRQLVALFRDAFSLVKINSQRNELERKNAFLQSAHSLVNRITGRYTTVRLLDLDIEHFNTEAKHYALSIIINKAKGKH